MNKKYLTEYENPKAWDRVRDLCHQIESGQLDDKIPEIMDEIHNLTPPTVTQYLWVNCYEESCDMDRELMKSLRKRINQLKLNENMNKKRIRLTNKNVVKINNGDLQKMISEAVRKYVNDGNDFDLTNGKPVGQDYYDLKNERAPKELKGRCTLSLRRLSGTIGNLGIMMDYCDDEWSEELSKAESHLREAYHIILNIYKQIDGDEYVNGEPLSDDRGW